LILLGGYALNDKLEIDFGSEETTLKPLPLEDDRDALYALPLSLVPLETKPLRTARMIKNMRLESVVEVFHDDDMGSGQFYITELGHLFEWPETADYPDRSLLMQLSLLPSYDVYSLRMSLRRAGVQINDINDLQLSQAKQEELNRYMTTFTRPLITRIYGGTDVQVDDFEDILRLFKYPDKGKAMESLRLMAEGLGIDVYEVPQFLEDYGDIFLSLSYYRQCLDTIEPLIENFITSMREIKDNWQLKQDRHLMKTCETVEATLNNLTAEISGRFENFDRSTSEMWNDISATRFRKVESLIKNYHVTTGGILCALWVKMDHWQRMFPKKDMGGPIKKAEFIMAEMRQGLDKIKNIEKNAPMLADLEDDD